MIIRVYKSEYTGELFETLKEYKNHVSDEKYKEKKLKEKKIVQIIENDSVLNNTQRVTIYHDGNNLMDSFSGQVLVVDSRTLYKQKRFSKFGEEEMLEFAKRSGFNSIQAFFSYYYKLTGGKPFRGIIRYKDGHRWFMKEDSDNNYEGWKPKK